MDSNLGIVDEGITDNGAENIYWAPGAGQRGEYQVRVKHSQDRSRLAKVEFGLRINISGRIEFHNGSVAPDADVEVLRFNWP